MNKVDIDKWPRKEIFEFFSRLSNPFYTVSFELDVTELHSFAKRESISFYLALTWVVSRAISKTDAFLYALDKGELVKYESRWPSYTDMKQGSEAFHIVTTHADDDIVPFCIRCKQLSQAQTCFIDFSVEHDNLIFISSLPWIPMTGFVSERDFNADDSVPRVTWGKYQNRNERLILNVTLDLNHRFIDGIHIGKLYQNMNDIIASL